MATAFQAETAPLHHHAAIRVRDIGAMLAFYRDAMGLPFIRQIGEGSSPRVVWLHAVQLIQADQPGEAREGTLDHLAISVLNIEQIAERLTEQGTALEAPISHSDFPELGLQLDNVFFRDPEGNRVELVQWTPLGAPATSAS